jgi:hypothetical protein
MRHGRVLHLDGIAVREMTKSSMHREFLCEGKRWSVVRIAGAHPAGSTLCFRNDGACRSLTFSRSGVPSEMELQSMSEEVLCALLLRATPE